MVSHWFLVFPLIGQGPWTLEVSSTPSPIRFQAQSHSPGCHEVAALPSAGLDWEDPAGRELSLAGEGAGEVVLPVETV